MKIAVWRTSHEIADTVADSIARGLIGDGRFIATTTTDRLNLVQAYDMHICYGILRGASNVFKEADRCGKPWFNIDRGYWKPGHYSGYYRVSLGGTQQTTGLDKLEPDYDRLSRLNIDILDPRLDKTSSTLICPPTDYVDKFFNLGWWGKGQYTYCRWRYKDALNPLQEDIDRSSKVITFNSSVGWEALRQGIPVVSDPNHSIVGAYQKLIDKSINDDYNERRRLFGVMASLQLTLEEMKQGMLWPLIQKLLSL